MSRFLFVLIGLPLSIVLVALAVANRRPVTVSLDPFSPAAPVLSFSVPLFVVVFGALIVGVIAGGAVTWWRQGRFRREARDARRALRRAADAPPPARNALSLPTPRRP